MRIAIVLPNFHDEGGVERRTSELVKGLLGEGHDMHVFANRWKDELVRATVGESRVHHVSMTKAGAAVKQLTFALNARRATARGGFDLVHSQARTMGEDVVTAGGGSHRAWLEVWRRESSSAVERARLRMSAYHRLTLAMERAQYRRCRALIANSQFSRDCFIRCNRVPESKLHVVHNGVDCAQFSPANRAKWRDPVRAELGLADDEVSVLHMGAGFFRKGLRELIDAVALARANGMKHLRLIIVGGGDRTEYEKHAAFQGLPHSVRFIGARPNAERYYAAADIFALLSRFDPFANSTMEALASGLPVITTATNGVSEILEDGVTGFVVPTVRDIKLVADHLCAFVDSELRATMGAAGRALVEARFPWSETTRKTIDVYAKVKS